MNVPPYTLKDLDAREVLLNEGAHMLYCSKAYTVIDCSRFDSPTSDPIEDCVNYICKKFLNINKIVLDIVIGHDLDFMPKRISKENIQTWEDFLEGKITNVNFRHDKDFVPLTSKECFENRCIRYLVCNYVRIFPSHEISIEEILNRLSYRCMKNLESKIEKVKETGEPILLGYSQNYKIKK